MAAQALTVSVPIPGSRARLCYRSAALDHAGLRRAGANRPLFGPPVDSAATSTGGAGQRIGGDRDGVGKFGIDIVHRWDPARKTLRYGDGRVGELVARVDSPDGG